MLFMKFRSFTEQELEDVKEDYKGAKRVGQYRLSPNAVYLPDGTYVPTAQITGITHDRTSVHVSGCCAGGVPVERLVLSAGGKKQQLLFDSKREVERALAILGKIFTRVKPSDPRLDYCGRIDDADPDRPVMVWAGSYVLLRFRGTGIHVTLQNMHDLWSNRMGFFLDGKEGQLVLYHPENPEEPALMKPWVQGETEYSIADGLAEGVHELIFFKRQDSCHYVTLLGFEIVGGDLLDWRETVPGMEDTLLMRLHRSCRRIEIYGDSVSNGEVSELADYEGKEDPEHVAEWNNVAHSYSWILADRLNARLQDVSQGGIALLPDTGYFHPCTLVGMRDIWDKLRYNPNPEMGRMTEWDFARFTPQLVIVAIGQNDAHPYDYMKEKGIESAEARNWIENYKGFLRDLRGRYPAARILLITTLLNHEKEWDEAIEQARIELADDQISHYLFKRNGCGTPGHLRTREGEEMARELEAYLETIDGLWE